MRCRTCGFRERRDRTPHDASVCGCAHAVWRAWVTGGHLARGRLRADADQGREAQLDPTTYTLPKAAGVFVNAVTAFSTKPLVSIAVAGVGLSILALAFTAWIIVRKLVWGINVEGWASVMAATMVIGGVTLFFNGVMAIYIAKIFLEVKQRPRAIVREIYQQGRERDAAAGARPAAWNTTND